MYDPLLEMSTSRCLAYPSLEQACLGISRDMIVETETELIVVTFYPVGRRDMKVQYNRENDVLTIHLSEGTIDHAEETDGVIVHFSPDDHPVLLEVLDASEFLARLTKITATAQPGKVVPL